MSLGVLKGCNICKIVRFRQLLRRWRNKTLGTLSSNRSIPSDVPAGHIAVLVGASRRRFVIRASYLNHPIFTNLLFQAEEHGFSNTGLLAIPCDETIFEDILQFMWRTNSRNCSVRFGDFNKSSCNSEFGNSTISLWNESKPLLEDWDHGQPTTVGSHDLTHTFYCISK